MVEGITFTWEAMATMTAGQLDYFKSVTARILGGATRITKINVTKAGFDLPDGYLTVNIVYATGGIYGGLSPQGDLST